VAFKESSVVLLQSGWHHIVGSIGPLLDLFYNNRSLLFLFCMQLMYGISVIWRFAFAEIVHPWRMPGDLTLEKSTFCFHWQVLALRPHTAKTGSSASGMRL